MRKYLLLISFILFQNYLVFADELSLTPSEVNIFSEKNSTMVRKLREIRKIDSVIDQIKGKIVGLSYLSNIADPEGEQYKLQKSPLGLSNDPIRVKMNLLKAQDHLYLSDPLVANNIVQKEIKNIDPRNRSYISWANKLLFEANRQLNKSSITSEICLKMLVIGGDRQDLFSTKWKLSCSLELFKEVNRKIKTDEINSFKEKLLIWSNSPVVKNDSDYMILSAVYISLGLRKIYLNNKNSIRYLEEAIAHTKSGNKLIARAYLALALLKYESGENKEALSIIRFIADDFEGYGKNLKYFEKDDVAKQISRLCLARFHAAMGNLNASETWYRDVLLEKSVTGADLLSKEKIKVQLEYAHILYAKKNFIESAKAYKLAIQNRAVSFNISDINKAINNNRLEIRTSNFILARILSKTSGRNFEAEVQLLNLLGDATSDLKFVQSIKDESIHKQEEYVQNIIALSSLASEYGIASKEVFNSLQFKDAFSNLSEDVSELRSDLANSLNAADYTYSGINEARAISSLYHLSLVLDEFKKLILSLDEVTYEFVDMNHPGIEFLKRNRFELIKRVEAMDDEISRFKLKNELEDNLYHPKIPGALQNLTRNMGELNAEMAGVSFLFASNDNKIPKEVVNEDLELLENSYSSFLINDMFKELNKITIDERYFQIKRSLNPTSYFIFQKRSEVLEKTINSFYDLYIKNRLTPYSIGEIEIDKALESTWSELFSAYKGFAIAISNIKERMFSERKEIISKIDYIKNNMDSQELILSKLRELILKEYSKMSAELANQVEPRIKDYIEYINISIATHNKGIYDLKKERDLIIEKSAKEREKWLNSLRQSVDMGLMR